MWYYAPADVKSHLLFLANEEAAVKYMGFETIDQGLRVLIPWSSIQLEEYSKFATPGREFLVYQTSMRPGWLLSKVVDDGATAEIQKQSAYRSLVRVRIEDGSAIIKILYSRKRVRQGESRSNGLETAATACNDSLRAARREIGYQLSLVQAGLPAGSQPRISALVRGKIGLFTIDTLVNMVTTAGLKNGCRYHGR